MNVELNSQGNTDQWLNAGTILNANNEHNLAQRVLLRCLKKDPHSIRSIRELAIAFQKQSRFAEALLCARQAARIEPTPETLFHLGEIYYNMGEDQQALATFRDALMRAGFNEPLLFELYKNVGNIFVRQGDFESGEEYYDKAFTINPDSSVLLTNYGTLEIQKDNLSSAKERFVAAIEKDKNCDRAWVGLALVHKQSGDTEIAIANIERALDINVENKTAVKLLVEWGSAIGSIDKPLTRVQNYLERKTNDEEIILIHAQLLWIKGRFREARLELEHVRLLNPENAVAQQFEKLARETNA